ncbi:VOC family protein [Specibacter sp. NPDC078692]|uniref:VOC family protein n=1 Tax=Specibacter sp. NPDC078692 TaxID=3155818 RepID=UPI003442BA45
MTVRLTPYLNFRDTAKAALEFYQSVFGGTLAMSTYAEFSMFEDPAESGKIMHGMVSGDHDVVIMGADVPNSMELGANSSVCLSGDDEAVLRGWWAGLLDGATVAEPLTKAPWGDTFGLLTDKFGVPWMVNIDGSSKAS